MLELRLTLVTAQMMIVQATPILSMKACAPPTARGQSDFSVHNISGFAAFPATVAVTATAATIIYPPAEPLLRGSNSNRKLAQWYGRGRGWGSGTGNAQLARNNAAIVNTQYAIRSAVESGASLPATAGAAYYGNDQAYLASQRWYPYGRWWGRH
jgi:hypothetical protein